MSLEPFIQNWCKTPFVRYSKELTDRHDIILLLNDENFSAEDWNNLLTHLNPYGAVFIDGCHSLVYSLVRQRSPILIHKDNISVSVYLPIREPIDKLDKIEKLDYDAQVSWIIHHSNKANKMILAEDRFFKHIIYNRFHEEGVKFL